MTNRDIIIFTGGMLVGTAAGVFSSMHYYKTKYEKIANEQISDVEEYYRDLDNESRNGLVEDHAEINPVESNDGDVDDVLSEDERDSIKQKLLDNYARTSDNATNYSHISKEMFEAKRAAGEQKELEENDPDFEDEPVTMTEEEIADSEHKRNINKPPRIISADEYSNLPAYIDTQTLYFYHYDMVVTDDNDEEIDDPGRLIGDALEKYGFSDSTEPIIFVMNYQLDTAYEIQRVMASFSDQ